MKVAVIALVLIASLPVERAAAHPGHGDPVVIYAATVVAIEPQRVQLEAVDRASASIKRVWWIIDAKTVVRVGKQRLGASELRVGQVVDCAGETDLGPNDEPLVRAITFRLKSK